MHWVHIWHTYIKKEFSLASSLFFLFTFSSTCGIYYCYRCYCCISFYIFSFSDCASECMLISTVWVSECSTGMLKQTSRFTDFLVIMGCKSRLLLSFSDFAWIVTSHRYNRPIYIQWSIKNIIICYF